MIGQHNTTMSAFIWRMEDLNEWRNSPFVNGQSVRSSDEWRISMNGEILHSWMENFSIHDWRILHLPNGLEKRHFLIWFLGDIAGERIMSWEFDAFQETRSLSALQKTLLRTSRLSQRVAYAFYYTLGVCESFRHSTWVGPYNSVGLFRCHLENHHTAYDSMRHSA